MADLAAKGTYVKLNVNVWYDKKQDSIHLTSQDKDLPPNGMHMTAKKGTQSDTNLRTLLDDFGCGPLKVKNATASEEHFKAIAASIAEGHLDSHLAQIQAALDARKSV